MVIPPVPSRKSLAFVRPALKADPVMTSADAAALASEVLSETMPAHPVTSGGDHRSWWIDEHHVLRWAPDPSTSQRLQREVALRRWLPQYLRAPVPDAVADGTWRGHRWVLDIRLTGSGLNDGPFTTRTHIDLVDLLFDIGRCPVTDVTGMGLPKLLLPDVFQLAEAGRAARRALGMKRPLTPPATTDFSGHGREEGPVLVHADFKSDRQQVAGPPVGPAAGHLRGAAAESSSLGEAPHRHRRLLPIAGRC